MGITGCDDSSKNRETFFATTPRTLTLELGQDGIRMLLREEENGCERQKTSKAKLLSLRFL